MTSPPSCPPTMTSPPSCPTPFSDHIYKTVSGVDIPLRLWPVESPRAWLLWFHGGGFTAGKHYVPNAWVVPAFRARGIAVVSAAYRLTPEVGLSEIVEDCADAYTWCRANLPHIAPGLPVDNYVVGGDSAGGTLACLAGLQFAPPPRAVVDIYGLVDLTDPYNHPPPWTTVEPAERSAGFVLSGKFSAHQIQAAASNRDLAAARVAAPWSWEMEPNMDIDTLQRFWGVEYEVTDADELRMDFITAANRDRTLVATLLRKENKTEDEYRAEQERFSPLVILDGVARFPPTVIVHGRNDQAVKIEQSERLAARLKHIGTEMVELYHPSGEHCFEAAISGPDDEGWAEYVVPVLDFVEAQILA